MSNMIPELDAMMHALRARHEAEQRAMEAIAGAIHESARAASIVTNIGSYVESLRQPVPLHSQPMPPAMPPNAPQTAIEAERGVDEEWQQMRRATFANGAWPQGGNQ